LKHVVFSDVHGNLEALEAVLAHAGRDDVASYVCLGDLVGYGANPNECIERLRAIEGAVCLKGNHDAATVDEAQRTFFHEVALEGVRFSEKALTPENREFLEKLPYAYDAGTFLAVHASPFRPEAWEYVLDQAGAERAFASMGAHHVAFIGH